MTIAEYEYEIPNNELDQFDDSWTDADDDGPEINHKEIWMVHEHDVTPIRQLTEQEMLDMQEETDDLPF